MFATSYFGMKINILGIHYSLFMMDILMNLSCYWGCVIAFISVRFSMPFDMLFYKDYVLNGALFVSQGTRASPGYKTVFNSH